MNNINVVSVGLIKIPSRCYRAIERRKKINIIVY